LRLLDLFPEWRSADSDTVVDAIRFETLCATMSQVDAYYTQALPFWRVLPFYGIDTVTPESDQEWIPCRLASHGTQDKKASASYFRLDRNSGEVRPAFYCYKCAKMLTSFWFVYCMERDFSNRNLKGVFKFIHQQWGVPPPLDIWFEFDPEIYYAEGGAEGRSRDPAPYFREADEVAKLKNIDPRLFLSRLKQVLAHQPST
jgi:hypothetical protein